MAGGLGMELAEMLQFLDRQVVAGEVQEAVEQHRAVAVGQHEAVASGPFRIGGVVAEMMAPQDLGDVGHAHRHTGVAGVCLLDGVHRQKPQRVGQHPGRRRRCIR